MQILRKAMSLFAAGTLVYGFATFSNVNLSLKTFNKQKNRAESGVTVELKNEEYGIDTVIVTDDAGEGIIDISIESKISGEYKLFQNYPNPFSNRTIIMYYMSKQGHVSIIIYGLDGRAVRNLVDDNQTAGIHGIAWDGKDDQGIITASSVYIYRIKAGKYSETKKMTHLKGNSNAGVGIDEGYYANIVTEVDSIDVVVNASKKDSVLGLPVVHDYEATIKIPIEGDYRLKINLDNLNQSPVFLSSLKDTTINEGDTLEFDIKGITYDPNNDSLIFEVENSLLQLIGSENGYFNFVANSAGIDNLIFSAFDNEYSALDSVVVNVSGIATTPISPLSYNEDEVYVNAFNIKEHFNAIGVSIDRYEAVGFSNVVFDIDDSTGQVNVYNNALDFNGTETGAIRAWYNDEYVEIPLEVNVNPMDDFRGQHKNNYTGSNVKAKITIGGVEYETDIEGLFDFQVSPQATHTVTARTYDEEGNPTGYRRTKQVQGNQDNNNIIIHSVPYPIQEGVTPELFKAFCEEANFRMGANGFDYNGLKTMLKNPDRKYWISSHGDSATFSVGGVATAEEQAYVDSLIENEINPYLGTPVPLYVEDPNSIEIIPAKQDGMITVVPRDNPRFGIIITDNNQDGIADWAIIYLPNGQWDEAYKGQILEEFLSALIGINDVNNDELNYKTVLRYGGKIFQIDEMLIKICEYYQPLEQRDNILGM